MKIKHDDYDALKDSVVQLMTSGNWDAYRKQGLSRVRFVWDCMLHSGFKTNGLYLYLNDTHITTALLDIAKKVLP